MTSIFQLFWLAEAVKFSLPSNAVYIQTDLLSIANRTEPALWLMWAQIFALAEVAGLNSAIRQSIDAVTVRFSLFF